MARSAGYRTSAKAIRAVERQRAALDLRKAGKSLQEIADALGYRSHKGAHEAIKAALVAMLQDATDEVRRLEVARLDALLAGIWSEATGGKLFAIDRVLMIMDRRAKLLGLDAPQKVDHEHRIQMLAEANGFDPDEAVEEARRVLREARG